jgi:hypothetical protein
MSIQVLIKMSVKISILRYKYLTVFKNRVWKNPASPVISIETTFTYSTVPLFFPEHNRHLPDLPVPGHTHTCEFWGQRVSGMQHYFDTISRFGFLFRALATFLTLIIPSRAPSWSLREMMEATMDGK